MYWVVEVTSDQKDYFDEVIKQFPQCDFMQTSIWGDLKEGTGWKPIRLLLYKGDAVKGAASLLKKKIPFGEVAQREKAIFVKFDPDIHSPAPVLKGYFMSRGIRSGRARGNFGGVQPRHVCRLNLERSLEDIFNGFHHKTRYNIRLAQKKGVTIRRIPGPTKANGKILFFVRGSHS